jgi:hypothetical protein
MHTGSKSGGRAADVFPGDCRLAKAAKRVIRHSERVMHPGVGTAPGRSHRQALARSFDIAALVSLPAGGGVCVFGGAAGRKRRGVRIGVRTDAKTGGRFDTWHQRAFDRHRLGRRSGNG